MAKGDYICCGDCDCKLIYDGSRSGRDRLEELWGDTTGPIYTVKILCPDCQKKELAAKEEILNRLPTINTIIDRIQRCETMREIERTIEQGEHLIGQDCVRLAEAAGTQIGVVKARAERAEQEAAAIRKALRNAVLALGHGEADCDDVVNEAIDAARQGGANVG